MLTFNCRCRLLTWQDAMDKYGSDKPDVRFGFEIQGHFRRGGLLVQGVSRTP